MKKLLYISDLNEDAPLYHSQVLPHIAELSKYFEVVVLKMTKNEKAGFFGEKFNYLSVKGDYSFPLAAINFNRQKRLLGEWIRSQQIGLIYSRGLRGGLVGAFIKRHLFENNALLLNDTRGISTDGMRDSWINRFIVSQSDSHIFRNADILFLVSSYLKGIVCNKYGFNKQNAYVFPTFVADHKFDFVEENRIQKRKELGHSDSDIVVLYSGNIANYQNVAFILESFSRSSNPNLKMVFLTNAPEINTILQQYQIAPDKIIVKSVQYSEIQQYYHAADFGVLIRDNTTTNKSAAPTKFSEYVNSGLALIINEIDSDYVRDFKEKRLEGILLNKKEDLLNCFNSLTISEVKRNHAKVNTLGNIVKEQREILKSSLTQKHSDALSKPVNSFS